MSAQKFLVLLVCSAAALAAAGQQPTQLFADWLDQRKPGKARLSSTYSAAEVQDVCMREHKVDGCSCYGRRKERNCCWTGNVDTDMTCCHDKSDKFKKLEKMTEEIISTGKCSYTQAYLEKAVKINDYDDSVMKVGTFSGICTLNKDSEICGDPACDGMSVTIQGDILKAENVAFEGKPVMALRSDSCEKLFKGDCDATPKSKSSEDAGTDAAKFVRIASASAYGRPYENYEPKYKYAGGDSKYEDSSKSYGKSDGKYGVYYPDSDKKYGSERKHDDGYGKREDSYGKHDERYGKREEKHEESYYEAPKSSYEAPKKSYYGEEKKEDSYNPKKDYYEEPKHEDKYYEREEKYDDKHDYEEKKGRYYKGKGEVFMGTFYTVNRIHNTKSYSGVYQSVVVIDYDEKYLDYAPEGAYVARPNEVYFRFVKSGSEPYKS